MNFPAASRTRTRPGAIAPALRRFVRHGTLTQLAALAAVVRLGNVGRAADVLHMAPSTVSGHLRKLSDAAGVALLRCDGRQMWPTPAGQALAEAAGEVFDTLARAEAVLAALRDDAPMALPEPAYDESDGLPDDGLWHLLSPLWATPLPTGGSAALQAATGAMPLA